MLFRNKVLTTKNIPVVPQYPYFPKHSWQFAIRINQKLNSLSPSWICWRKDNPSHPISFIMSQTCEYIYIYICVCVCVRVCVRACVCARVHGRRTRMWLNETQIYKLINLHFSKMFDEKQKYEVFSSKKR